MMMVVPAQVLVVQLLGSFRGRHRPYLLDTLPRLPAHHSALDPLRVACFALSSRAARIIHHPRHARAHQLHPAGTPCARVCRGAVGTADLDDVHHRRAGERHSEKKWRRRDQGGAGSSSPLCRSLHPFTPSPLTTHPLLAAARQLFKGTLHERCVLLSDPAQEYTNANGAAVFCSSASSATCPEGIATCGYLDENPSSGTLSFDSAVDSVFPLVHTLIGDSWSANM